MRQRTTKSGTPIARLELDAPRRMIESALLTVGSYAETQRQVGSGDHCVPAGEMVGIYRIEPGTPPYRMCHVVWIHEDERTAVEFVIREDDLRPVTGIVLTQDAAAEAARGGRSLLQA